MANIVALSKLPKTSTKITSTNSKHSSHTRQNTNKPLTHSILAKHQQNQDLQIPITHFILAKHQQNQCLYNQQSLTLSKDHSLLQTLNTHLTFSKDYSLSSKNSKHSPHFLQSINKTNSYNSRQSLYTH